MNKAIFPTDDGGADHASGSRAFRDSLEIRAAIRRTRRQRELLYLAIIAAAVLVAVGYGTLIASPRFLAEARFSVRASSPSSDAAPPSTTLISTGASQSAAVGFVDGFAVNDFLKSRDCMHQLGKRADLTALLGRPGGSAKPSGEQLYRAYQKAVSVNFNMLEQVNVVRVSAFSPNASEQLGNGLLALAQDFVARMDEQGVADSLDVAARQLRTAEQQAVSAANALAQWRAANHNVDPAAESTIVMQTIGQIEQELTTARINYEKILALGNPDHPMLKPAQEQVAALERQLGQARGQLAGSGNSEAARLKTYEQLKNAQTFADNNLAAARNAYQQAFLQTMRLRRYLTVIARPVAEDQPSSPNLGLLGLEGLLVGVLLAFATSIGLSIVNTKRTWER
jgi:capsular polysaccharide transport system permease protein